MAKEELKKELERLKDFKVYVFEGDIYVKAEDYKEKAIENRRLKEENEELKDAMKELNNYNKFRIQENEKLKEKLNKAGLEEYGFFNER